MGATGASGAPTCPPLSVTHPGGNREHRHRAGRGVMLEPQAPSRATVKCGGRARQGHWSGERRQLAL